MPTFEIIWLVYLFIGVSILNLIYFISFSVLIKKSKNQKPQGLHPVSVIVCAKNEAQNLKRLIPELVKQQYPKFEIILVNDASSDETLDVMEAFAKKHSNIQISDVKANEAFWGSKKYALTLGIKRAKYKHLVFTDADCVPASNNWLYHISKHFEKKTIVLGYGAYEKKKPLPLNTLIRFDTLLAAMQYLSFAKLGIPYAGVGRNMAYTAKVFYDNSGFMSHIKLRSGDDDLFINQSAHRKNTVVEYHPDSFTYSVPKSSWKAWFKQKKRHLSTAVHYRWQHQLLLGVFQWSQLFFWLCFLAVLMVPETNSFAFWGAGRILLCWMIFFGISYRFKEPNLGYFFPLLEIILMVLQLRFLPDMLRKKNT
ncbi:MAG: glycosyltransferase, partial [Flavobacteriaceae bacterium]|nr:glycosyltransferase [Flavobacteriaceae bacterium]